MFCRGSSSDIRRPLLPCIGADTARMSTVANEKTAPATHPSVVHTYTQNEASVLALTFGSVGVVYGDIGTSPLYAFREAVAAAAGSQGVTRELVLGVLSLIVWALVIVVAIKYVLLLLRADNN